MPSPLICDGALILYGDVGVAPWADVNGFTSNDVVAALAELGSGADVVVRINSGGGNAFEGAAIHAILSGHRGKITTVVEGIAASAASIIAMAGVERIIAPGSLMMVHDPAGLTIGTADEHDETAAMLRTLAASMASIYAAATGRPVRDHLAEMAGETWLSAMDAVAGRYATRIGTAPTAATACAPFPFRAYAKAPRELVALADSKGWSARAFTASHAAGRGRPEAAPRPSGASTDPSKEIREVCAKARKPERADAFIAAGISPAEVRSKLLDEMLSGSETAGSGTEIAQGSAAQARASMERTLRRQGITPVGQSNAGQDANRASVERVLRRSGQIPIDRS